MKLVVIAKNLNDLVTFCGLFGWMEKAKMAHVTGMLADFEPVVTRMGRSLSSIANEKLDASMCSVFGLVHADMVFEVGSLEAFYACAMTGAVCGACGRSFSYRDNSMGYEGDTSYVWSKDWGRPNVRQLAAGYPANPLGPCPVSTLDSSCIFFRRDLGLRFDERTFDGFHCHGEDLCLQAQSRGIPVLVPAANAWHASPDHNGPNWGAERDVYYHKMKAKWHQLEFVTC